MKEGRHLNFKINNKKNENRLRRVYKSCQQILLGRSLAIVHRSKQYTGGADCTNERRKVNKHTAYN